MATPADTQANDTVTVDDVMTAEQRDAAIGNLPEFVRDGILNLNRAITEHNNNVSIVKAAAAEKKDEKLVIQEIIENNPGNDQKLAHISKEIEKLKLRIEKLYAEGWEQAKKYQPEESSADQITAAHEATKKSSGEIREQRDALTKLSAFFGGQDLTKLLIEMDSTRGIRLGSATGESGGTGVRPTYKQMFVVNSAGEKELIEKEIITKNGKEMRSTTTILAQELTRRLPRGTAVNAAEITTQMTEKLGYGYDKITAGQEVTWEFSKDVADSDGNKIDTKTFTLVFVK